MRKMNIAAACLLTLLLVFSLAACGAKPAEEDTAADEPQKEQEVVVDAGEEEKVEPTPNMTVGKETNNAESEQKKALVEDTTEHIEVDVANKPVEEEQTLTPDVTEDKQPTEIEKSDIPASDNSGEPAVPQQPVHQHSYNTSATLATCTTKGYTTYTCECGHSYTADYNGGNGHSYEEVYENLPVYESVPIVRCGACHENLDDVGGVAHIKEEALAGNPGGGSSYGDTIQVLICYEDQLVGYACAVCGAER